MPRRSAWDTLRAAKAQRDADQLTKKVKGLQDIIRSGDPILPTDGDALRGWDDLANAAGLAAARRRPSEPHISFMEAAAQPLSQLFWQPDEANGTANTPVLRSVTRRMRNLAGRTGPALGRTKPSPANLWDEVLANRPVLHQSSRWGLGSARRISVIDPRTSRVTAVVDVATGFALGFTALVTPCK